MRGLPYVAQHTFGVSLESLHGTRQCSSLSFWPRVFLCDITLVVRSLSVRSTPVPFHLSTHPPPFLPRLSSHITFELAFRYPSSFVVVVVEGLLAVQPCQLRLASYALQPARISSRTIPQQPRHPTPSCPALRACEKRRVPSEAPRIAHSPSTGKHPQTDVHTCDRLFHGYRIHPHLLL